MESCLLVSFVVGYWASALLCYMEQSRSGWNSDQNSLEGCVGKAGNSGTRCAAVEPPGLQEHEGDIEFPTATPGVLPQPKFLASAPVPLPFSWVSCSLWILTSPPLGHRLPFQVPLLSGFCPWFLSFLRSPGFFITVPSICTSYSHRERRKSDRERDELI